MTTAVQVVFQGGGARLCLLMAVVDVLQQSEGKSIEVKRVAGSSAGAIAAVMLASKKPISFYKERLQRIAPQYLEATAAPAWLGAWRVFRGYAFFRNLSLRTFFEELFTRDAESAQLLEQLPIKDTRLYYTDLYTLASMSCPAKEGIASALEKSCRFPFAFIGFASTDDAVDGGLAQNLPVDELKSEESTVGTVIGISFASRNDGERGGLISYVQQLFSAAIQSSVTRSEMILGKQNVFSIETKIGTFDFHEALGLGFNEEYNRVTLAFGDWLNEWLDKHGPRGSIGSPAVRKLLRPVLPAVPWSPAIINEIDREDKEPTIRALSIASFETAILDEAGAFTGKYSTRTGKTFQVLAPTNILQFEFQIGKGEAFASANLGCTVENSRGGALPFVHHVEEVTKPGDLLRSFRVFFLFEEPLTPGTANQPFHAQYEYEGEDPYPNLKEGADASTIRMDQQTEEAVLCIGFPKAIFEPAGAKQTDIAAASQNQLVRARYLAEGEVFVASEELPRNGFLNSMGIGSRNLAYFELFGRRARDLKRGQVFGLLVERALG